MHAYKNPTCVDDENSRTPVVEDLRRKSNHIGPKDLKSSIASHRQTFQSNKSLLHRVVQRQSLAQSAFSVPQEKLRLYDGTDTRILNSNEQKAG